MATRTGRNLSFAKPRKEAKHKKEEAHYARGETVRISILELYEDDDVHSMNNEKREAGAFRGKREATVDAEKIEDDRDFK